MKTIAVVAACLVALPSIVTGASLTNYKAISRTDTYESGTVATNVDKTAGGYVAYVAWSYALQLIPKAPDGGKKVIATGIRGQELEGEPAFLPLSDKVECFDMKSILNGCYANTQVPTAVGVPTSCTVQFSARSHLNGKTTTKPAIFNAPLGTTIQGPNTTTFDDSFKCIDRVDITLLSAVVPGDGATVTVVLDDFKYVAYVKQ